jgi:sortase (surface protein transpeptidase)
MDYEEWFWGQEGADLGAEGPFPEAERWTLPPRVEAVSPSRMAIASITGPAIAAVPARTWGPSTGAGPVPALPWAPETAPVPAPLPAPVPTPPAALRPALILAPAPSRAPRSSLAAATGMSLLRMRRTQLAIIMAVALLGIVGFQLLRQAAGSRPGFLTANSVVDNGADLALEKAAAISVAPAPVDAGPKPPGRLIIPSIGVDAQILPVGVDKNGAMAVTNESYDVGWYSKGPAPGDPGDAVIDGHLDWYDTSQAVFYNLKNVQVGDPIKVQRLDGSVYNFTVTGVKTVGYNADTTALGLFALGGPPRLSLITCGGTWSHALNQYVSRVVVDAKLVDSGGGTSLGG